MRFRFSLRTCLLLITIVCACFGVWEAFRWGVVYWVFRPSEVREDWPYPLNTLLEKSPAGAVDDVKVYDLGGLVDHEYLWRLKCDQPFVDYMLTSEELNPLQDNTKVPDRFWNEDSVEWWTPEDCTDLKFYKSVNFQPDERGPDGELLFVGYSQEHGILFVIHKSNF
ncbi:hypothetical protein [Aeoliella sp.]|uniref:hypothetical protein n=1 Tax=Aeoliella sp. TaxID=2795800 RepID=UPI003CCC1EFC